MHPCKVSDEVDGTNHKTSHDGMFKVVRKHNYKSFVKYVFQIFTFKVKIESGQKYLDQIGGIKVTLGGTSITNFQKKNGTLIIV